MKYDKDPLGSRMKNNYENRTKTFLPRRTYTIIRLDGKCFKSYTRQLKKPFDYELSEDIDNSIIKIMSHIQGCVFAYTQNDEISILLCDFENNTTDMWFDGNVQKMTSISASLMTAEFNKLRIQRQIQNTNINDIKLAYFDSRVFTIPDVTEVMNMFIWRNKDCYRNSISMVSQSLFPHSELMNKSSNTMQEMIFQKTGQNWANYPESDKNGRMIIKETYKQPYTDGNGNTQRSKWTSIPAWDFAHCKERLLDMIPKYN